MLCLYPKRMANLKDEACISYRSPRAITLAGNEMLGRGFSLAWGEEEYSMGWLNIHQCLHFVCIVLSIPAPWFSKGSSTTHHTIKVGLLFHGGSNFHVLGSQVGDIHNSSGTGVRKSTRLSRCLLIDPLFWKMWPQWNTSFLRQEQQCKNDDKWQLMPGCRVWEIIKCGRRDGNKLESTCPVSKEHN